MGTIIIKSSVPISLSSTVFSALGREKKILESALNRSEENLKIFEQKYSMKTQDFYDRFQKGDFGDEIEFMKWAGEYEALSILKDQLRALESIQIEEHSDR